MYLNTLHEYFYVYYKASSLFCRSVWPQPGDGKLFISRGSLNSALGGRECKRGSLCIIQLLYIRAFRYICAVMHRDTHIAAAAAAQKTNIQPRDIYKNFTLCQWGDKISEKREARNMPKLCFVLCVWVDFFPLPFFSPP